ncbi:MAG TPA: hypothetical protein VMP01_09455 [Pirellulaceae bacterium]|nr:hypothetical protein [Pirellulaceae bacterium]
MTALLEPSFAFWMLLVALFVAAAILAAMWTATARREPLIAAAVAIGLMPLLWMVERLVVTDREAIEATLHQIAADVKSNNRAAVLGHIDPTATWLRARAEGEIANYQFTECKVNKLHGIEMNYQDQPLTAVAEFNVYVSGTFKIGSETLPPGNYFRRIELHLRQDAEGQWRVENYSHHSPIPGRRDGSSSEESDIDVRP